MLSCLEAVQAKVEGITKNKMLSFSFVKWPEWIRSEISTGEEYDREARMRSLGLVWRRDSEYRGPRIQESWRENKEENLFVHTRAATIIHYVDNINVSTQKLIRPRVVVWSS